MIKPLLRSCLFLGALLYSTTALAEGFSLYEYSARSVALGGATMARTPDPSVISSNPAAITRLDGIQLMSGVSLIRPHGKAEGIDRDGNDFSTRLNNDTWPIPHFYYTHKINDRFSAGVGMFTRFGLGFEYPHEWAGRFNIYEVSLQTASLNPNIAFAVTDELSIAAGVEIMKTSLDLKKRIDPANLGLLEVDANIQNADSIGYGYNFAAHYQFNPQWAAGLAYRSHVTLKNEGEMQYTLVKNNAGPIGQGMYNNNFKDGDAWGRVRLPESISGGISYAPTDDLSFEVGAVWTRWSRFDALDIHLPDQNALSVNDKAWRNAWRFNFGAEYEALDWLTLRAGYVYDQSPMTEKNADYLIPSRLRHIYSVGAGLSYESWTLDLAYAYIDVQGRNYRASDTTHTVKTNITEGSTDIYSMSIGYKF